MEVVVVAEDMEEVVEADMEEVCLSTISYTFEMN
jgi:hypothetical protein